MKTLNNKVLVIKYFFTHIQVKKIKNKKNTAKLSN